MSHIDEGALHAYLDGALEEYAATEAKHVREHLETCGECAQRLEEERGIRNRATSILALATPQVEAPSFEELKAYVQTTRPARSRLSVRVYRLSWAASVVLALGVGWLARGDDLERAVAPGGLTTEPAAMRPSPAGTDEAMRSDSRVQEQVGNTSVDGAALPPEEERGFADAAEATPQAAGERAAALDRIAAPDVSADRDAAASPAEEREVVAASGLVDSREALTAGAVPGGDSGVVLPAVPPRTESLPADPVVALDAPEVVEPVVVVTAAPAERSRAEETEKRRDSEERARVPVTTAQMDVGAAAPTAAARAFANEPAALLEVDDALAVPGVELLSYANLAEGTSPGGVHVVQRLENGEILDVYHLPEGVDPAALPPVESVRNEVRAQRDGGWVVLRARLSTEELRALLARLVPEG